MCTNLIPRSYSPAFVSLWRGDGKRERRDMDPICCFSSAPPCQLVLQARKGPLRFGPKGISRLGGDKGDTSSYRKTKRGFFYLFWAKAWCRFLPTFSEKRSIKKVTRLHMTRETKTPLCHQECPLRSRHRLLPRMSFFICKIWPRVETQYTFCKRPYAVQPTYFFTPRVKEDRRSNQEFISSDISLYMKRFWQIVPTFRGNSPLPLHFLLKARPTTEEKLWSGWAKGGRN